MYMIIRLGIKTNLLAENNYVVFFKVNYNNKLVMVTQCISMAYDDRLGNLRVMFGSL